MKYIDLHLHLDGSISIKNARVLAKMQNIGIPESDDELKSLLCAPEDCASLDDYLKCFEFPLRLLQTKESISKAVYNLLEELKANDLIYAEVRFAPQLHTRMGLSQDDVVTAAIEGASKSELPCGIILCCMRGEDNERENLITCKLAEKYQGQGVVALDLAGAESIYPTEDYIQIFNFAYSKHIPLTVHCGEAAGPESVEQALLYGCKRIGHGVRAIENKAVMREIIDRKIVLELCPKSNMDTKAMPKEQYPIKRFMQMGVLITLNTDNLSVSDTTIQKQYEIVKTEFNITDEEVNRIMLNSVDAAFASDSVKERLRSQIFS